MARWKPPVFKTTEEYSKWAYMYVKKLAKVVPSLSIATTVIRFVQLALMVALSLAYATGNPGVYHDVLVWDKNVSAPFQVTVYRNITSWTSVHNQNLSQPENTLVSSFLWTKDSTPGCGKYSCNDTRFNCSGDKWQSNRIGYGDSLGFEKTDGYSKRIYAIDRAVFGLIVVIVSVSAGQTLWVIAHHLEPSGIAIYRFIASIDFIFSLGYIAIGLVPLLWPKELDSAPGYVKLTSLQIPRHPSQRYGVRVVLALGWLIGVLYIAHFIIDIFLIVNLEKFAPIAKLPGGGLHQLHQQVGEFGPQTVMVSSIESSELTGSAPSSSTAVRRVSGGPSNPESV
ncbi:hypothetical protein L873DRAFT_1846759 [Choiromyces venosus 120613-1]|uniref:Uncharacterized protein n=1 Tax=Choiromyces venosus 120613-1 TaxID=1336337 RepID=A0A3N4J7E1_9PEZI|nr:hypothetical protein L873DRAFT_1846759 [Choiromyces venosus 120613-1]